MRLKIEVVDITRVRMEPKQEQKQKKMNEVRFILFHHYGVSFSVVWSMRTDFFPIHRNLIARITLSTMRFLASADETGNIKEIVCKRGVDTSKKDGEKPELVQNILQKSDHTNVKNRIVNMTTYQDKWLVSTRLGGFMTIYDMSNSSENPEENYNLVHSYKLPVENGDKPIALITFEESDFVMVAFESSVVFIIYFNGGKFDYKPLSIGIPSRTDNEKLTLNSFVHNPYVRGIFACGGKDNDLQVIKLFDKKKKFTKKDFESRDSWNVKVVFRAENVEPDHLDLEVPIWISDILFFRDAPKKGFKLVTSTRYGHIRKYDTLEDKEPIESYKVSEKPIITLTFANSEQDEIIISDTHTFVARLSLTKVDSKAHRIVSASAGTFFKPSLKVLGKYSEGGNTGAIHGVDIEVTKGVVAFGGLDRYLRVFNINTRALILKVYLGTQISSLNIVDASDGDEESKERKRELQAEEEDEEFWNDLDEKELEEDAESWNNLDGKRLEAPAPIIKKRKRL